MIGGWSCGRQGQMSHDALKFWADERDTFIVPDVFQKDILAGTAGFEFFRGKDRVVDLASEVPLQLAYGFAHNFLARLPGESETAGAIKPASCLAKNTPASPT